MNYWLAEGEWDSVINATTKSEVKSNYNYKLLKMLLNNWTSTFELHFKVTYKAKKQKSQDVFYLNVSLFFLLRKVQENYLQVSLPTKLYKSG